METFSAEGTSVASALLTSIERDQDDMATLRSLCSQFPGLTNPQFGRWSAGLRTASRVPGDIGYGDVKVVRRADLGRGPRWPPTHLLVASLPPSRSCPPIPGHSIASCVWRRARA